MNKKVKIQNIKNPSIVMEVEAQIAGLYVGTHEWIVLEEKQNKQKEENKEKLFGNK